MATSEQSIRVSAKGEFGQLQKGLKDLQGDLKGVMNEVDKGARKGGVFDDTSFRALNKFTERFKDSMDQVNAEFAKQNDIIDDLADRMRRANDIDKVGISETIKAREKELDVIRRQVFEVERLYKKRTTEAENYEIKVPGSRGSSGGSSGSSSEERGGGFASSALTGMLSKVGGVIGTVSKLALGLAGVNGLMSMAQDAYNIAYQRQVGSLDLAQRIRGYSFLGSASDMYKQSATIGRSDKMGYSEQDSWGLQDSYTSKGGALAGMQQYALQKFARGYGLDLNQVGNTLGGVKQLGGVTQPKDFADMIAASVSQSGMLPRIMEVMQAHTGLLSSINTTFKDGSSAQILAYQTTLDKIGTENGMTKLTGQQGASVISGLNGIYQPNNDKWLWTGIAALQNFNRDKYGKQGLYELQENFEDGLQNPDNLPAMAQYLKKQSGGNNNVFKRLMQAWLQDGGYNATKRQVDELDSVTQGFSVFDSAKIKGVVGSMEKTSSGAKYDNERKNEYGQNMLDTQARFDAALGNLGEKYLLPIVNNLKEGFTDILEDLDKAGGRLDDILLAVGGIAALVAVSKLAGGASNLFKNLGRGKGAGEAGKGIEGAAKEAEKGVGKEIGEKAVPGLGQNMIKSAEEIPATTLLEIKSLSQGSKALQDQLVQIYKATGDMEAVKYAVSGKASAGDIIDMLSKGDANLQKELSDHYEKTQSMSSTMEKANELTSKAEAAAAKAGEGSWFSKFVGGTGSAAKSIGKSVLSKGTMLGGLIDLGFNLYDGNSVGHSVSAAGGSMVGMAAGGVAGESIGGMIGGGIGALFGGVGAVPGAAIGSGLGGLIGSIGGGIGGDWAGGKAYDLATNKDGNDKASAELVAFAQTGQLDIDGLSTQGLQKLEELKSQGLIDYTDMKMSTTANVASMTEEGKASLLKLQQDGLVSIGGLQSNGSVKITALSDAGTAALSALNQNGSISITDFQKTGKLQITSLSKEGAESILNLQKNGSLSLTSMDKNTASKLKEIKKDTGDSMDNIYKEHKGAMQVIKDWFGSIWDKIKVFLGLGGKSKNDSGSKGSGFQWYDGKGGSKDGTYTGKYADWINDAAQQYGFDPYLIAGIIQTESSFNPNDVNSSSGATGLGQFLQSTADDIGLEDRTDPKSSIYAIAKYLDMRRSWAGGDIKKAIMGYGEGTEDYYNKVVRNQELIKNGGGDAGTGDSDLGNTSYGDPGGSVFHDWRDHINSGFGVNRGDHYHGGIDLAANQGTGVDAVANGYVSFINMDDGGQYDDDGTANTRAGGTEVGVTMADGNTYYYAHLSHVADELLEEFKSGQHVDVTAGEYIGDSGGTPGVAGSGYSTTGNHLHFGYLDQDGNAINPEDLLDSLSIGDATDIGKFTDVSRSTMRTNDNKQDVHVTVDVNLKGDANAITQLNDSTIFQLKTLVQQAVEAIEAKRLSMQPTVRG